MGLRSGQVLSLFTEERRGTDRHYSFDKNYIDSPTCHFHKNPSVFHCLLAALHDRKSFLFQIELRDQLLQMFRWLDA